MLADIKFNSNTIAETIKMDMKRSLVLEKNPDHNLFENLLKTFA